MNTETRPDFLKIGLIGCGAIGTRIAQAIDQGEVKGILVGINDLDRKKAEALLKGLTHQASEILDFQALFEKAELIVEAATPLIVRDVITLAVYRHKNCMILSTGGLLGIEEMYEMAQKARIKVYCPSGSIAGLDAVSAAAVGKISLVRLTTSKPPQGLKGAPYVIEKGINLDSLKTETIIFEGNAIEATKAFPQNINVAAALSLVGIGPEKTLVTICADPKATRNCHQIEVIGEFGRLITRTENLPSPFNPRTSYLAALSAIACLRKIVSALKIGC